MKKLITALTILLLTVGSCNLKENRDPGDCSSVFSDNSSENSVAICYYNSMAEINVNITDTVKREFVDSIFEAYHWVCKVMPKIEKKYFYMIRIYPEKSRLKYTDSLINISKIYFSNESFKYIIEKDEGFSIISNLEKQ